MDPIKARWLLERPLDYASLDPDALAAYRPVERQPDGALLTTILAVDR
ncbi:MAG: hypothetical protein ACXV3V_04875 [Actinomycetes bacterium]